LRGAREEGILIGRIQTLEKWLKRPPSDLERLETMRMDQLKEMVAELEKQAFPGNGAAS
jgi:hypothetical protein